MKPNGTSDFQDFIDFYPKYKKYEDNIVAQQIFNILSELPNVQKMILASYADKPALGECIQMIESAYGTQTTFDLSDDFTKQALGAMVKVILEPFGFEPVKQKNIPKGLSLYLKSASLYKLTKKPKIKLIQKLDVEKADE